MGLFTRRGILRCGVCFRNGQPSRGHAVQADLIGVVTPQNILYFMLFLIPSCRSEELTKWNWSGDDPESTLIMSSQADLVFAGLTYQKMYFFMTQLIDIIFMDILFSSQILHDSVSCHNFVQIFCKSCLREIDTVAIEASLSEMFLPYLLIGVYSVNREFVPREKILAFWRRSLF